MNQAFHNFPEVPADAFRLLPDAIINDNPQCALLTIFHLDVQVLDGRVTAYSTAGIGAVGGCCDCFIVCCGSC